MTAMGSLQLRRTFFCDRIVESQPSLGLGLSEVNCNLSRVGRYGSEMMFSARYTMVLGLGCLALVGCSKGPDPAEIVTGRVVFKGKPVAGAGIRFYGPHNGFGLVANLDAEGRYVTPSPLPVGFYEISITGSQGGMAEGPGAPLPSPVAPTYVDEAYHDGATSGLEARVTFSQTTFDFDVSEPPKVPEVRPGMLVRMAPAKGHK
jgi:hypothetical protein